MVIKDLVSKDKKTKRSSLSAEDRCILYIIDLSI